MKKNNVRLCSVLERIDDSPESIMTESVLEGMAEYYSKNLGREVMKGMQGTALQCKHIDGCTPLGYDLDSEKKLVINEHKAKAVKIIFEMFVDGYGYSTIISHLNEHGFTTKKGRISGKNSLYEILRLVLKVILQFKHEICKICGNKENRTTTKAVLLIFLLNNMKISIHLQKLKNQLTSEIVFNKCNFNTLRQVLLDVGK